MLDEVEDVLDGQVFRLAALVADFAGHGDGELGDLAGLAVGAVAHLHESGAEFDDSAADGAVLDDARVPLAVGGGGHGADQLPQVGLAADLGELPSVGEVLAEGDGVDFGATEVEVGDGPVDDGVPLLVVGVVVDGGEDFGAGELGHEAGAEGGPLGHDVVGRGALVGRRGVVVVGYGFEVGGHQKIPRSSGLWPATARRWRPLARSAAFLASSRIHFCQASGQEDRRAPVER